MQATVLSCEVRRCWSGALRNRRVELTLSTSVHENVRSVFMQCSVGSKRAPDGSSHALVCCNNNYRGFLRWRICVGREAVLALRCHWDLQSKRDAVESDKVKPAAVKQDVVQSKRDLRSEDSTLPSGIAGSVRGRLIVARTQVLLGRQRSQELPVW